MRITRRNAIAGIAALAATPSQAAAPASGTQAPGFYRYRIGEFELTAINDGTWYRPIDEGFVRNVAHAQVQQELVAGYMAPDILPTYFTALAVNTGRKLVLIDTGTGGQYPRPSGTLHANLAAAGIDPRAVDVILISHLHADHINGIKTKDNERVFPNAEIMIAESEWAYWMDEARLEATPVPNRVPFLNARRVLRDLAKDIHRFTPGRELVPGVTSVSSIGHTPGHTSYLVSSGNASVLVLGDVTNHPWLFLRHPDWQGSFDVQPEVAVRTRKEIFDRAAADRQLVQGYHFPFPGTGYIARTSGGYEFVPRPWETPL
jgi:glyoxylase-like metal-dependent hydrolase (beta-lactamase superfamily II)